MKKQTLTIKKIIIATLLMGTFSLYTMQGPEHTGISESNRPALKLNYQIERAYYSKDLNTLKRLIVYPEGYQMATKLLFRAASIGDLDMLLLFNAGLNPADLRNKRGQTALTVLINSNVAKAILARELIQRGTPITQADKRHAQQLLIFFQNNLPQDSRVKEYQGIVYELEKHEAY